MTGTLETFNALSATDPILEGLSSPSLSAPRKKEFKIRNVNEIDYRTALLIGAFQCLSLIPGTSRSGSTILGAIILGVSRPAGAEFSFFLAIPTMLGASFLKMVKFLLGGTGLSFTALAALFVGCVISFVVSVLVIRALMDFVRKRSFAAFGFYRIGLGIVVIIYFAIKTVVGIVSAIA